jgi:hypothetical protein
MNYELNINGLQINCKLIMSGLWNHGWKSMWMNFIHHVIMFNVGVCDNLPPCDNQIFSCNQNLICSIFLTHFSIHYLKKCYLTRDLVKKDPIWIGVKNTILSIWIVLCDWGGFFNNSYLIIWLVILITR